MKRLLGSLAVVWVTFTAFGAGAVSISLTPQTPTLAEFLAAFPNVGPSLVGDYDFDLGTAPKDGVVGSAVFFDSASSLYAYAYRIGSEATVADSVLSFTVPFGPGAIESLYFIVEDIAGAVFPSTATYETSTGTINFSLNSPLEASAFSYAFGAISDLPPSALTATVNGAAGAASVTILSPGATPVPEPGTLVLLGSGLLAFVMRRSRR